MKKRGEERNAMVRDVGPQKHKLARPMLNPAKAAAAARRLIRKNATLFGRLA